MKLYVVYWVDLDDDCLKKSEVKILGVFDNSCDASKLAEDYDHEGYSEDHRCYYTKIKELELNEISKSAKEYLQAKKEEEEKYDKFMSSFHETSR